MFRTFRLITKENLSEAGIKFKNFSPQFFYCALTNRPTETIEKDFLNEINALLINYYQETFRQKGNLRQKLNAAATNLYELLSYDYGIDGQIQALERLKNSLDKEKSINIKDIIDASIPPTNSHNEKLNILDEDLKQSKLLSLNKNCNPSLESLNHSILLLLVKLDKLNPDNFTDKNTKLRPSKYIDKFDELDKNNKSDFRKNFIVSTYKAYKQYTGYKDKYNTSNKTKEPFGKFFNLVKICFEKNSIQLDDKTIKNIIRKSLSSSKI
jgi:hypothetical protein